MNRLFILIIFFLFTIKINLLMAQPKTDSFLEAILNKNSNELYQRVLQNPGMYRCQVVYTQINRTKKNTPEFTNYYYNYDPQLYFNPASTVKLPLAFLALEKLNTIGVKGVNKFTTIQFDSSYEKQVPAFADSTSANGLPSIAHYIKKAFLISDNDGYNRLYQFVGQQNIHRNLHAKEYTGIRIPRQFMGFTEEQNRRSNQVRFLNKEGKLIYSQPPVYNQDVIDFNRIIKLGKAHFDSNDNLINEPFDFTRQNNISLLDLQQILQSVLFPSSVPPNKRFNFSEDDRQFLIKYLSQFPSETSYPKYDTSHFYDSYVKFFFRDSSHKLPEGVRVFNKVGWSYGFLTDVSYVIDLKNNVEFMLTATVYVNSNEVLNDGKYDYDSIGYPFMYQLGQTIYGYELNRRRMYKPDLSNFKIKYDNRDARDLRPSIITVDN